MYYRILHRRKWAGERSACPKLPCLPTAGSQTDYSNHFSHYHDHSKILMGIRFITWHANSGWPYNQHSGEVTYTVICDGMIMWMVPLLCLMLLCIWFGNKAAPLSAWTSWRWYSSKTVHLIDPWYYGLYPWLGFSVEQYCFYTV